jgi:hypothetical protein
VVWGSQPVAPTMSSTVAPVTRSIRAMICARFDPLRGSPAVDAICLADLPALRFRGGLIFALALVLDVNRRRRLTLVILSPIRLPQLLTRSSMSAGSKLACVAWRRSASLCQPGPSADPKENVS